jgi:hypothetical protein
MKKGADNASTFLARPFWITNKFKVNLEVGKRAL